MSFSLVIGGTRSGKSEIAEAMLPRESRLVYLATAEASEEPEWLSRIERHAARRGGQFDLVEMSDPSSLGELVRSASLPMLIDSMGTWIARLLDLSDFVVLSLVSDLVESLLASPVAAAVVSEEVGMSIHPPSALGRRFADLMGEANQRLAAAASPVILAVAGIPIPIDVFRRGR